MPASLRIFVVCLMITAAARPASGEEKPDLSGIWVVDLEASDSLDSILVLMQRSWAERKMASHAVVTNTITQKNNFVLIEINAPFFHETENLLIDNEWHNRLQKLTGKYRSRTSWKGDTLVTENRLTLPDGEPARIVITRDLDPKTGQLLQVRNLEAKGQKLKARQVWRRQQD